jgi:porphobilinogen synthase
MPGQYRWPVAKVAEFVKELFSAGVGAFLLFGIPSRKDKEGSSAWVENSVIAKAIKEIRRLVPEAYIITDVCLCAYTDHGHCGIPAESGSVCNDDSLIYLSRMACAHAEAGADMVAPSDMMDGRVGHMRQELDKAGHENLPIMSYSAKYASAFYGPFREAAGSAPGKGDRRGYQMSFANSREALVEMDLDLQEGADILMVKPGIAYLDILKTARERFNCPLAIYQVSGEYSMIKSAAEKGWINEKDTVLESLIAMKRAGADLIISYFAPEVIKWLMESDS